MRSVAGRVGKNKNAMTFLIYETTVLRVQLMDIALHDKVLIVPVLRDCRQSTDEGLISRWSLHRTYRDDRGKECEIAVLAREGSWTGFARSDLHTARGKNP